MDSLARIARAFTRKDDDLLSIVAHSALGPCAENSKKPTRLRRARLKVPPHRRLKLSRRNKENTTDKKTQDVGVQATPQPNPRGGSGSKSCRRAASDPFPTWWTTERLRLAMEKKTATPLVVTPPTPKGKIVTISSMESASSAAVSDHADPTPQKMLTPKNLWIKDHVRRRTENRIQKRLQQAKRVDVELRRAKHAELKEKLDPDAIHYIRDCFLLFDLDSSGTLELHELRILLRAMDRHVDEETLADFFNEIDVDGTGDLDEDEFIVFMSLLSEAEEKSMAVRASRASRTSALSGGLHESSSAWSSTMFTPRAHSPYVASQDNEQTRAINNESHTPRESSAFARESISSPVPPAYLEPQVSGSESSAWSIMPSET